MSDHVERERLDLLAVRIAEGRESAEEMAEFRRLAAADPGAWEVLAELQRDDRELRALAVAATEPALEARLPFAKASSPRPRFAAAAGWLVATALGIALVAGVQLLVDLQLDTVGLAGVGIARVQVRDIHLARGRSVAAWRILHLTQSASPVADVRRRDPLEEPVSLGTDDARPIGPFVNGLVLGIAHVQHDDPG